MEAWEQAVVRASLQAGAKILAQVLEHIGAGRRKQPVPCACGQTMTSQGLRSKRVTTLLGTISYQRSLYGCPACGASCFPGDQSLDIESTGFSPGVRRLMARAGSRTSFADAEDDLATYAHIHVHRRNIERITEQIGRDVEDWMNHQDGLPASPSVPIMYVSFDGTSVPMRRQELAGRKGKQPDGSAKGREVKLGCVFTQTSTNKEGFPERDEQSTSYCGGIESSTLFGERIYQEASRRGMEKAREVVVLTDGAAYNKTIAQHHFPNATHIIDLYHAREHLHDLAKLCRAEEEWPAWKELLDEGAIDALLANAKNHLPRSGARRQEAIKQWKYIQKNRKHMQYDEFRRKKYFIGSGVIEAGCRTLVGQRLKQAGMFWSLRGSHAVLQLRCCMLSERFDQFWEDRAAA